MYVLVSRRWDGWRRNCCWRCRGSSASDPFSDADGTMLGTWLRRRRFERMVSDGDNNIMFGWCVVSIQRGDQFFQARRSFLGELGRNSQGSRRRRRRVPDRNAVLISSAATLYIPILQNPPPPPPRVRRVQRTMCVRVWIPLSFPVWHIRALLLL